MNEAAVPTFIYNTDKLVFSVEKNICTNNIKQANFSIYKFWRVSEWAEFNAPPDTV